MLPLTALLALGACTTATRPPEPKLPVPQWQAAQLIESMKRRNETFRSLRALAQVDYAGPEGKHGFQEAVIVQRPSHLRLETLTFLGAILIFTANEREILGYHPREGVYVRAQPKTDNLRRYTQIPLELHEVTTLLMGLPPIEPGTSWRQEGNTLIASNGSKSDVVSFETHQPVPTRWQRINGDGRVELSAEFGDYVAATPGLFPREIRLEAPLQKKKLAMRYKEPELNGPLAPELFIQQIPAHAKEVPIEAVGH